MLEIVGHVHGHVPRGRYRHSTLGTMHLVSTNSTFVPNGLMPLRALTVIIFKDYLKRQSDDDNI